MNVKQLKERISQLPDDMIVIIHPSISSDHPADYCEVDTWVVPNSGNSFYDYEAQSDVPELLGEDVLLMFARGQRWRYLNK